jgi:hypothetical protein
MSAETFTYVLEIYQGSDGDATKALYERLTRIGPIGVIATNLFRAQKNSARAKVYRGGNKNGRYRDQAYERKRWAMDNLAKVLIEHAETCSIRWGWGIDRDQTIHRTVLYIDLPTGQVSFHTDTRGAGPDYAGEWDGRRGVSVERVCAFVGRVLEIGA